MCGSVVGDALMQMAHELENALRTIKVLCCDKVALEERVAALEKENVTLKLHYLKNQLNVVATS